MTPEKLKYYRDYYRQHKEEYKRSHCGYAWRLHKRAIVSLGGICVNCGETDPLVLQINHLKGNIKKIHSEPRFWNQIINGEVPNLDVRCANCNIRYEYERGNRTDWSRI